MKRLVLVVSGAVSLVLTVVAWTTVTDRPLSREYVQFLQRARSVSADEQARQRANIRKFDDSSVWREPVIYIKLIGPFATIGCFAMAFRKRSNRRGKSREWACLEKTDGEKRETFS
jgi:hypothetical protein